MVELITLESVWDQRRAALPYVLMMLLVLGGIAWVFMRYRK